jgi:hypothetical protein
MKRQPQYKLPPAPPRTPWWLPVTDVPCPVCGTGTIRWHEAGRVPGYRKCDQCAACFIANGDAHDPTLTRVR